MTTQMVSRLAACRKMVEVSPDQEVDPVLHQDLEALDQEQPVQVEVAASWLSLPAR